MNPIITYVVIYAVLGVVASYLMSRRRCPRWVAGVVGGFFGLGVVGNMHRLSGQPITVQDVGVYLQGISMIVAAIAASVICKQRDRAGNGVAGGWK